MKPKITNWGLKPNSFAKPIRWAVDNDEYAHNLSPEEQAYLSRFNDEYYRGQVKKNDPNAIHKTSKQRKSCYSNNNTIRRDLYAISSSVGLLELEAPLYDDEGNRTTALDTVADTSATNALDALIDTNRELNEAAAKPKTKRKPRKGTLQ